MKLALWGADQRLRDPHFLCAVCSPGYYCSWHRRLLLPKQQQMVLFEDDRYAYGLIDVGAWLMDPITRGLEAQTAAA
jgi:hypothetical protein